jgi:hypothetical protein
VDPPEVQSQDAGDVTAEHGRKPDLGLVKRLWCTAGTGRVRRNCDHRDGQKSQARHDAGHRAAIDTADADRRRITQPRTPAFGNGRRLERALDRRRLLAPEVGRARGRVVVDKWRIIAVDRPGPWAEWDELFARSEPVAREAYDLVSTLSVMLFTLGLPSFRHP